MQTEREHYRVLLLEDNPGDSLLVHERLEDARDHSFEVLTAETLDSALDILGNEEIDVMITDLNVPDSSGMATLRAIRKRRQDMPILVLTGTEDELLRREAFAEGVQDFIAKGELPARLLGRSLLYALERYHAQERQRQILKLVSSNPDAVLVVDAAGIVQFVNEAASELFGRTQEDFVGELISFSISEGESTELTIISRGERRIAEMRVVHIYWMGRPAYAASLRDITEQRRMAEQLQQSQKMDAIGRLAGGVAHDFNNLLSVINGYTDLLLDPSTPAEDSGELLLEIRKAGQRAAELTRQLLAFSRKSIIRPKSLNLNHVITELERLLSRLIGEDINLTTICAPDLGCTLADPSQIEQVIMNLVVNARDAMPTGGNLTIETHNVLLEEGIFDADQEIQPGHYVQLVISDDGNGMDPETRQHIFEPFFTTKGIGEGTGLGLAMSYGIIRQSGGHISVYTEHGHGTTFRIYLPRTDTLEDTDDPAEKFSRIPTGEETILLVEDEPGVRRFCRIVLESKGYTVLEAHSAQMALELAGEHERQISLLLTDVIMPQRSGRQLTEDLLLRRPGMKVLYMSGYTDDAVVRHGILRTDVEFLQKPFTASALASTVRRILDLSEHPRIGN
ncbi:response regulator [bacterium]|nr:response regulator [bacterium]